MDNYEITKLSIRQGHAELDCGYVIFMSLIVLYFLPSTSVLSFYIDVVLTLSIRKGSMQILRTICLFTKVF